MIQSLKQIKNRIRSIGNTRKVTSAMEMISVAKLNRMNKALLTLKPYCQHLESLLNDALGGMEEASHPFLRGAVNREKAALCVITSDSGLCGVYNNAIIRFADEFIAERGAGRVRLITVGRKGSNHFRGREGLEIAHSYAGLLGRYSPRIADEVASLLMGMYLRQDVHEVYLAYTHYETALIQRPVVQKILNIERSVSARSGYLFEPGPARILEVLLPKYVVSRLRLAFLEAFTSEHAARTIAMKMATDNADELLQALVMLRNKVRQATITQEIMEVIAASEALKG